MNRDEFVLNWANRVRKDDSWRAEHTAFVNAQILNANEFYKRLILSKNGKEKFKRVTGATDSYTNYFYEFCQSGKPFFAEYLSDVK